MTQPLSPEGGIPGGVPVSAFPDVVSVSQCAAILGVSTEFVVMMCATHSLSATAETVVTQAQAERIRAIVAAAL